MRVTLGALHYTCRGVTSVNTLEIDVLLNKESVGIKEPINEVHQVDAVEIPR